MDRNEAGSQLAEILRKKKIYEPIVVAIPRGGIPVADPIAKSLGAKLRLSMTRKIAHPYYEEYAIGAVSLNRLLLSPKEKTESSYIEESIEKERRRIREMVRIFDHEIKNADIKGKSVILVDDGIATGKTMELAITDIKEMGPEKIILCVPVCSILAHEELIKKVDEIISLIIPPSFAGIGAYYHNFNQLTDNEVIEILRKNQKFQA